MTKSIRVSINPSKTRKALAKGQFCGFMTVYEILYEHSMKILVDNIALGVKISMIL